jgi:hypothetical protein
MQANTVFDRLVSDLSREERKEMLEKLENTVCLTEEPLGGEDIPPGDVDIEKIHKALGVFQRIFLFFYTLFTGRSREEVIEKRLLNDLAREIQKTSPTIIDFKRRVFLPSFAEDILILQEAAAFFFPVLRKIMGPNKTDFIAFVAGVEMEDLRERLLLETDPYYHVAKFVNKDERSIHGKDLPFIILPPAAELSDSDIKRMMDNALEDLLQFMPQDGRGLMYQNMKFLQYLYNLSAFPFDRLIGSFFPVAELPPVPCVLGNIRDLVVRLTEIMHSMKLPPSPRFIRTMFLFFLDDQTENAEFNFGYELTRLIEEAENSLNLVRKFNKKYPMVLVARYVKNDLRYQCPAPAGGEDWFALFKQFWRGRIDQTYRLFSAKRKQDEITGEILEALESTELLMVEPYIALGDDPSCRGAYPLCLGFLKTFFQKIFPGEFNRNLKTLLLDGLFYKEDNRSEFTDAYNGLLKLSPALDKFENRLTKEGDIGRAVTQMEIEITTKAIKERKMKNLIKSADMEAEALIQGAGNNLQALIRVLNGILYGEIGGRYDTLSNLSYIGGRSNQNVMTGLDLILNKAKKVSSLIEKIFVIENTRV